MTWLPSGGETLISLGLVLVSVGAWRVWEPIGLIVLGAGLCALGIVKILGGR